MPDQLIGYRVFTDKANRPIFQEESGRQYVMDDDGNRVYGVWLMPEDEPDLPIIVPAKE